MRIVIQRVTEAAVSIVSNDANKSTDCEDRRAIGPGFMILLGVCEEDTQEDADWLVKKVVGLRVFDDEQGVMNRSVMDVQGEVLVVSQFTLFASYKKGNRPSWFRAARHEISVPLYEYFCSRLSEELGKPVATGEFGAMMQVSLVNDGPVTICMDTKNKE
jgi:D-tyrosyl-tRNA(Tyr) deacylase